MATRITEKFEFKTDIIVSYDGHEQRIKLRQEPRHYLTFDYTSMNEYQSQWLRALLRYRQDHIVYVPMWHNICHINQFSPESSKAIYIDPKYMFSLRYCDTLMFFREDNIKQGNDNHLINYIDSNGLIGLKNGLYSDKNVIQDPFIPLLRCIVQPVDNMAFAFSNGAEVSVNFEDILHRPNLNFPTSYMFDKIEDNEFNNIHNLPRYYNGVEVLQESPCWVGDGSITMAVEKNSNKLDNDTGKFLYDLKGIYALDKNSLEFNLLNRESISNFIRFFHRMSGRLTTFYAPSWINDIVLFDDIIQGKNFIYTDFDLVSRYYGKTNIKKSLVLFMKDGSSIILDILGFSREEVNGRKLGKIFLSNSIQNNIYKKDVAMISFFNLCRFDDDVLQIDYETTEVATTRVVLKELVT